MKQLLAILILPTLLLPTAVFGQRPALVPMPTKVSFENGKNFDLPEVISIASAEEQLWKEHLVFFGECLQRMSLGKHRVELTNPAEASVVLSVERSEALSAEAYTLEVTADQIRIKASTLKGLTRATATLIQLCGQGDKSIPQVQISDRPSVAYRNLLIDMGRNPHSVELLKETIDLFWYYKVDSLHLHLTDDQRFAFPSTAFPKLWDGLITLEEFKELEAYAVVRGVTIIPELEVPGHSGKLRGIYPEVFGKTPTDLASSEEALQGIKTLIDEMIDVFSSTPWVHIGGDEAYGVPEELQRDLINELHEYLKSKGKQTIVWEGPRAGEGENRVNKEVIHINWRTINYPADKMLEDGYRVINAAWDPLYIVDHYPRTNFTMTSPQHIFETLKLTRFKHVNPGIPTFARPIEVEPSDQLIGYCMCWWEGREENYFAQVVPRLVSMADVAWNPGEKRDFKEFESRRTKTEAVRDAVFYPVSFGRNFLGAKVILESRLNETEIHFTIDGSEPTAESKVYTSPESLSKSAIVRAAAFRDGKQVGYGSRTKYVLATRTENLASTKPVTTSTTSGPTFSVIRLTDGDKDNLGFYLGYPATTEKPIAITIDLEKPETVGRVEVHAYTINGSFEKYTVEVSADGESFKEVGSRLEKPESPQPVVEHKFDPQKAQFIRILSHGNRGHVFDSFSKIVEVEVFEK